MTPLLDSEGHGLVVGALYSDANGQVLRHKEPEPWEPLLREDGSETWTLSSDYTGDWIWHDPSPRGTMHTGRYRYRESVMVAPWTRLYTAGEYSAVTSKASAAALTDERDHHLVHKWGCCGVCRDHNGEPEPFLCDEYERLDALVKEMS